MTVFLIFLFIGLVIFRAAAGFYVEQIPFFSALVVPLNWLCIGTGAVMGIFLIIKIVKEIARKSDKN